MSCRTSIKQFLRSFCYFFDVFCISHTNAVESNKLWVKVLLHTHIFCNAAFLLICHHIIYQMLAKSMQKNYERNQNTLFIYINYSEFVTNLSSQLIAHIEAFMNRHRYQRLLDNLQQIESLFKINLNYQIDYGRFRWHHIWNVWGYFTLTFLLLYGSHLFFPSETDAEESFTSFGIILYGYIMLIVRLRTLQVNMFIRLLGDFQIHMNEVLAKHQCSNVYYAKRLNVDGEAILECNYIYMNIWHASKLISECFGWSMVATCVQSLVDIMNTVYWTFVNNVWNKSDNFTISETINL